MGRKGIEIESLYGLTIERLKKMRNSSEVEFSRNVLNAVIMRYEGISTIKIAEFLLKSREFLSSVV